MFLALALHLLAVVLWVGGMMFALLALRPALAALAPPQRLGLLADVFARFLAWVGAAIVIVVATGGWLIVRLGGFGALPAAVHAMIGLAVVMVVVYVDLLVRLMPRLRGAIGRADWPAAAVVAERMRWRVAANLVLGIAAVLAGLAGRVH